MKKQKICIIGDGLTGLSTALALGRLNIDIHLIIRPRTKNSLLDNRTTAISPSNHKFLMKHLKKTESRFFWPSNKVDLFHEQRENYFHFMNFENSGKNLMYVTENYKIKNIFFKKINNAKNIKVIKKEVHKIDPKSSKVFFKKNSNQYDLILLCVGKKSQLIEKLTGKRFIESDYNEIAYTTIIQHKEKILGAKQYFLKEGPLAILPISKNKFSLIWSIDKKYNLKITEKLLKTKLKKILSLNLEKKLKISKIDFFPVSFRLNKNFSKNNALILGEGSYNIHTIAGQGFNLILRDVEKLYYELHKYLSLGMQIRDSSILTKFINYRKPENLLFGIGINMINNFFKHDKVTYPVKKIILKDINKFKFLKDLNIKISDTGIFK